MFQRWCSLLPRTGQVSVDALLAAFVLLTATLTFVTVYTEYVKEGALTSQQAFCLLRALRASDFLLHTTDGLAVDRHGLVPGNVVDCTRVYSAYAYLASRGFEGYVACGPLVVGNTSVNTVIKREAVWRGEQVVVDVGVCP